MTEAAKRIARMLAALSIALAVVVSLGVGYLLFKRSQSGLETLQSVDELRERFNQDRGNPRLVLLLSPT